MRSVDLSGLPRDARHFIAWNQSEGFDIPFHYDDQQGLLTTCGLQKGNHGESVLYPVCQAGLFPRCRPALSSIVF